MHVQITVLWIGFRFTGPISLCVDSFVFMFVYYVFFRTAYKLYYCNTVGWTGLDWSLIVRTLSSFSALTLWPIMWLVGPYSTSARHMSNITASIRSLTRKYKSSAVAEMAAQCCTSRRVQRWEFWGKLGERNARPWSWSSHRPIMPKTEKN